jgi:hypothetical protein
MTRAHILRLLFLSLVWVGASIAWWYVYVKAGTSVWPPALDEFRVSWLLLTVFMISFMLALKAPERVSRIRLGVLSVILVLVAFGVERQVGQSVRDFSSYPTTESIRHVWEYGGLLLSVVLLWTLVASPKQTSYTTLGGTIAVKILFVLLSLGLVLVFLKLSAPGIHGTYSNPDSQLTFFRERFQEMGLLLLSFFLFRLVLPVTITQLTAIFSRSADEARSS